MKIVACNSNRPLAEAVAAGLNLPLARASIRRFADMEVFVEIHENVRGEDVFVIQSTSYPTNDNLMELLITCDALRRGSARRITPVIPYFGYARQDRKSGPRTPISAKLVANLITEAGANRVLTMDLHAGQIQGFFDIPVDNLPAAPLFSRDIEERFAGRELMIVSPDVGGVLRARIIARRLNCDLAIIDKRRERAGVSEVMNIIGEVEGRDCIIIDDIVDSGGTLCNAAEALLANGARSVSVYVSHGVLSGGAVARIAASPIEMLTITDSIAATEAVRLAHNVRQLSIAPLLAEAMRLKPRKKRETDMKLYYAQGACSLGIHLLLNEVGASYELAKIDMRAGDQFRPEFLAVNPKAKVPALVLDNGEVITEFPAIAFYIAAAYPAHHLIPADPLAAARTMEAVMTINGTTHLAGFTRIMRPASFAPKAEDKETVRAQGRENFLKGMEIIALLLGEKDYVMGDFSIADAALFYVTFWNNAIAKLDIPAAINAHYARMMARPAVLKAMQAEGLA
jgi:ribose-phosphate pyrophosphokinase